jgi:hypothetical protein
MGTLALFKPTAAARIERNPVEVYLASLSATGRRSMAQKLRMVSPVLGDPDPRNVPWDKLKFEYLIAIRTWLVDNERSPATINATLAALRGTAALYLSSLRAASIRAPRDALDGQGDSAAISSSKGDCSQKSAKPISRSACKNPFRTHLQRTRASREFLHAFGDNHNRQG